MKTEKILKKINNFREESNVNLCVNSTEGSYIREFNRGKSFEFSKWSPLTKYTNDSFKQDFVSYKGTLLACNNNHVSEEPPVLKYENGYPVDVLSNEWIFVFSAGNIGNCDTDIDPESFEGYMPIMRGFSDDFNNDFAI